MLIARISAVLAILPTLWALYLVVFRHKNHEDFAYLVNYLAIFVANVLLVGAIGALKRSPSVAALLLAVQTLLVAGVAIWEWRRRRAGLRQN